MQIKSSNLLISLLLVIVCLGPGSAAVTGPSDIGAMPSMDAPSIHRPALKNALTEARAELKKITEDESQDADAALKQQLYEDRVEVVSALLSLLDQVEKIAAETKDLPRKIKKIEEDVALIDSRPDIAPPRNLDQSTLKKLEEQLNQKRMAFNAFQKSYREQQTFIENINDLKHQKREAAEIANKRIQTLREKKSITENRAESALLQIQLENEIYKKQTSEVELTLIEAKETSFIKSKPYAEKLTYYFEKLLARREAEYDVYNKAVQSYLKREQQIREQELSQKQQAVDEAGSEVERFIAGKEEALAEKQSIIARLKLRLTELTDIEQKGEKRLLATRAQVESIHVILDKAVNSAYAGRRVREFFENAKEIRRGIQALSLGQISKQIEADRSTFFDLEQQRLKLKETWHQEAETVMSRLPHPDRTAFKQRSDELLSQYRKALSEEIALLTSLIQIGVRIDDLRFELTHLIDKTEQILLSRLFWIRDNTPLGFETLQNLKKDIVHFIDWCKTLEKEVIEKWTDFKIFRAAALTCLLFGLIPFILIRIRKMLDQTFQHTEIKSMTLRIISIVLLKTFLSPMYLLVVSLAFKLTPMPGGVNLLLSDACCWLSWHLLIWLVARAVFGDPRMAKTLFNMQEDARRAIMAYVYQMILLRMVFSFLPTVFNHDPLMLTHVNRIGMSAFSIAALYPIYKLIRTDSAFSKHIRSYPGNTFVMSNWGLWVFIIMTALSVSVIMHITGYNYGGYRIYRNTLMSLAILFGMFGVYRGLLNMLKKQSDEPETTQELQTLTASEKAALALKNRIQKQRITTATVGVVTMLIIAMVWGVNEQVIKSFDDITIYSISTASGLEPVTFADISLAILTLIFMTLVLKVLPGIYDSFLFPRFELDTGMRYALLTISRYSIFTICVIIALSFIHLDLGRIGWLMAAVGFGLGFGMQEIFSNFISGLILLVERPVRIGDIVQVGGIVGTVSRINIRATTVTDFDRVEIIIPNKDFITQQVTNWTLGNKMIRVIVPIGVAYGSDPEEIIDLLLGIAGEYEGILDDPEPSALFLEHGDNSLNFELRCFIGDAEKRLSTKSYLNIRINDELNKRGIEIPYPQRDIHIRSDDTKNLVAAPAPDAPAPQKEESFS